MYEKLTVSEERRPSAEFGAEQLAHIALRRENLAKVLDVDEVRGVWHRVCRGKRSKRPKAFSRRVKAPLGLGRF